MNIKVTLSGLASAALLTAAVAATSAAPAFAACTAKPGSKKYTACVAKVQRTSALPISTKLAGATGEVKLPTDWNEGTDAWVCTTLGGPGTITSPGSGSISIAGYGLKSSGCSLKGPKSFEEGCAVNHQEEFLPTAGAFGPADGQLTITPENAAHEWGIVAISGGEACHPPMWGTHEMHGQYKCTILSPEVEQVEHEMSCESTGSELMFPSQESVSPHYTQKVALAGEFAGKPFSIYER